MHDVKMTQKGKITSNSNIGDFSGSLHPACYLSYGVTPLVNCGPRSNFFYIAITVLLLLALFTFLHTITFYHSIRLILCLQQTGGIDNLIVSWGKVLGCVVCRFHVAASDKLRTSIYLAPLLECRKASGHQPSEVWFFLLLVR
jgi:hypothetical protein